MISDKHILYNKSMVKQRFLIKICDNSKMKKRKLYKTWLQVQRKFYICNNYCYQPNTYSMAFVTSPVDF